MRAAQAIPIALVASACGAGQNPSEQPLTGTVSRVGATLEYVVEGNGRPCIVIGSHRYYRHVFSAAFKEQLQCAYADSRLFTDGAVSPDSGTYRMEVAVDDVEAVRQALGWQEIVVVGHSLQAHMALEYARAYPDHISGVVMIGMTPGWISEASQRDLWEAQASAARREAHTARQSALASVAADPQLTPSQRMIQSYVLNSALYWFDPEFDCSAFWDGVHVNMGLFTEYVSTSGITYRADHGQVVDKPVLVATGRHDYVAPYTEWQDAYATLPRMTLRVFERSGHTPQWEEADLFDATVDQWLKSLR